MALVLFVGSTIPVAKEEGLKFSIHILSKFVNSHSTGHCTIAAVIAGFESRELANDAIARLERQNDFVDQTGVTHYITKLYEE
jgi:hypothetical protein